MEDDREETLRPLERERSRCAYGITYAIVTADSDDVLDRSCHNDNGNATRFEMRFRLFAMKHKSHGLKCAAIGRTSE
jgi:hypothetical protein